jgi:hypothetical protein
MARLAVLQKVQIGSTWSPAHLYLLISGVGLIVIGAAGLIYNQSFGLGADVHGDAVFGILQTNGWHSLAGLLGGMTALAFAAKPEWARFAALSLGVTFVIVTIALVIWEPSSFRIASNTADNVVHALLGIGGIASAVATRPAPGRLARTS